MKRGVFCISLDTELIWGRLHMENYDEFLLRAEKVHQVVPKLLKLFDKYGIPATWAVVGHIMLSTCDGTHPEILQTTHTRTWFNNDPGTSEEKDPAWYGKSLFDKITQYSYHDIGCHTFAHLYWKDKNVTRKLAKTDLQAWVTLAQQHKIKATSFVFPKNQVNYTDLLEEFNFKIYRSADNGWFTKIPTQLRTWGQSVDLFLPIAPQTVLPIKKNGLIEIAGSFYFPSARGLRRFIPQSTRAIKAKKGIDAAIRDKRIFHLWTHPIDLSDETDTLLSDFEEILSYAATLKRENKIDIMTMADIAKLR